MNKKWQVLGVCLLLFFVSSCASRLAVTYKTDPLGAALYENERLIGYSPVTLYYNLPSDKKIGKMKLQGLKAKWISGAEASIGYIIADLNKGKFQKFTFSRPANFPGLDTDIDFSIKLQQLRIQQAQLELQKAQYEMQAVGLFMQMQKSNQSLNCTSTVHGNQIITNCQ